MNERLLKIATAVVARADRALPADRVLRSELKSQRGLEPIDSREISRTVFAFYRWTPWLKGSESIPERLLHAVDLQHAFREKPDSFSDEDLVQAVPEWIGQVMPVAPAWLRSLQFEPRLWLRARAGHGAELAAKLGDCAPAANGPLSDVLEYLGTRDLFTTPELQAGEFEIQNISSQMIGHLCAPKSRETWWDCCAGEGGKLLHLSDLMRNKGLIWATDRAEWRLRNLRRRAARAKTFNYRVALWEGTPELPPGMKTTQFDGILVDAPCSNVGTWQRNPHARWTTTPEDVRELARKQKEMLANVAAAVKPGGKLVYSVCTLTTPETIEVVEAFGKSVPGFEPLGMPHLLDPAAPMAAQHFLWPQETGGNGMFVAAWRKL